MTSSDIRTFEGAAYHVANVSIVTNSDKGWRFETPLPSVPGRKLTQVVFTLQAGTVAKYIIGTEVTSDSETPGIVKGGEEQSDESKTTFTFDLSETTPDTQYWIRCKSKAPRVTGMRLTYSL